MNILNKPKTNTVIFKRRERNTFFNVFHILKAKQRLRKCPKLKKVKDMATSAVSNPRVNPELKGGKGCYWAK
jgi:hypothetical protein